MRRSELVRLQVEDIDSERMIIHIRKGKGGKDRDVPLCPRLSRNAPRVLAMEEAEDMAVSHADRSHETTST